MRCRELTETVGEVARVAEYVVTRPRLQTAAEVMAALIAPARPCRPTNRPAPEDRARAFGEVARLDEPRILSRQVNWALTDLMLEHPEILLMREDVGRWAGVYGVTQKLQARFGLDRIVGTLLDDQLTLGLGLGPGQNDLLHPMVVRIAGLGYRKGFGGTSTTAIPWPSCATFLILACPSIGADAARMHSARARGAARHYCFSSRSRFTRCAIYMSLATLAGWRGIRRRVNASRWAASA